MSLYIQNILKLILFAFLLYYTAPTATGQEVGSVQSPLSHSETLWDRLTIPVCWEDRKGFVVSPFPIESGAHRRWVREAVETSWEAVSNINFVGWGRCNDSSDGIRILEDDQGPHTKGLGRNLDGKKNGMVLNDLFSRWDPSCRRTVEKYEYCIRAIAVHEFGHALGFAHEHNRSDRQICSAEPQGTNPTFLITSYDPESVMNYCSSRWNNGGNLSALDVAGVRMTYGPFLADTPAQIEVTGTIFAVDDERGTNETGSESYNFTIDLTETSPTEQIRRSLCVGGEVRVELDIRATLSPGSNEVVINSRSRLYEGGSCNTSDLEDRDQSALTLSPSASRGMTRHSLRNGGIGGGDFAEINLTFTRLTGDETAGRACTSCRDAAKNARFTSQSQIAKNAIYIKNNATNKCLSLPAGNQVPGVARAKAKPCSRAVNSPQWSKQKWHIKRVNADMWSVRSAQSNHCLNLKKSVDNREGGPVMVVGCNNHPDQFWRKIGQGNRLYKLVNVATGKCLSVNLERRAAGSTSRDMVVETCGPKKTQLWVSIRE